MIDGNFLDLTDRGSLSPRQQQLFNEINAYFKFFFNQQLLNPSLDFSKFYITFAFNLITMKLFKEADSMIELVSSSYYQSDFLEHMKEAEKSWQRAEDLKNKPDLTSKETVKKYRAEAEFLPVAFGIVSYLKDKETFSGKKEFNQFLKSLAREKFEIRVRPRIHAI